MSFFANLMILLSYLLALILPPAIIIFIVYKLIKKLSRDHIEYQYKYQQYKEAEAEIKDIEADVKRHWEEDR